MSKSQYDPQESSLVGYLINLYIKCFYSGTDCYFISGLKCIVLNTICPHLKICITPSPQVISLSVKYLDMAERHRE